MSPHDPDDLPDGSPVDPDVTDADVPSVPEPFLRLVRSRRDILTVIALGGAFGALVRYGLARALPHSPGDFPWSTLLTNVAGCLAIGVLMVIVLDRLPSSRLVRPFFGTGLLGGFTTFSTYAVDTRAMLAAGRPGPAAAYLFGTLLLGLLAVVVGLRVTERVLR